MHIKKKSKYKILNNKHLILLDWILLLIVPSRATSLPLWSFQLVGKQKKQFNLFVNVQTSLTW